MSNSAWHEASVSFDITTAPWFDAEVDVLNDFQKNLSNQPFTCRSGNRKNSAHYDGEGILIATREGWICPYCDYKQNWSPSALLQNVFPLNVEKLEDEDRTLLGYYSRGHHDKALFLEKAQIEHEDYLEEIFSTDPETENYIAFLFTPDHVKHLYCIPSYDEDDDGFTFFDFSTKRNGAENESPITVIEF